MFLPPPAVFWFPGPPKLGLWPCSPWKGLCPWNGLCPRNGLCPWEGRCPCCPWKGPCGRGLLGKPTGLGGRPPGWKGRGGRGGPSRGGRFPGGKGGRLRGGPGLGLWAGPSPKETWADVSAVKRRRLSRCFIAVSTSQSGRDRSVSTGGNEL